LNLGGGYRLLFAVYLSAVHCLTIFILLELYAQSTMRFEP
jgi:hypothetical protein